MIKREITGHKARARRKDKKWSTLCRNKKRVIYISGAEERGNISELISASGAYEQRKANPYLACACAAAEQAPRWRPKFREQRHLSRTKSILCERERTRCTHTWTLWSPHPLTLAPQWRAPPATKQTMARDFGLRCQQTARSRSPPPSRPHPALQNSHYFL